MSKWDFRKKLKAGVMLLPNTSKAVQCYLSIAPHNLWKNCFTHRTMDVKGHHPQYHAIFTSTLQAKMDFKYNDTGIFVANAFVVTVHGSGTTKACSFVEMINTLSRSTVFCQDALPSTFEDFLRIDEDHLGNSSAHLDVALLNGWTYNENGYSQRIMIYVIKIVEGGPVGTAKFVWTKFPFITKNWLGRTGETSFVAWYGSAIRREYRWHNSLEEIFYSEIAPLYLTKPYYYNYPDSYLLDDTYVFYRLFAPEWVDYYWDQWHTGAYFAAWDGEKKNAEGWIEVPFGSPKYPVNAVVYAEARRRTPTSTDEFISSALANVNGAGKIIAYDAPGAIPFAVLAEIDLPFEGRALGWMNGKYLVLSNDMKLYFVQLDGSVTHIVDTDIDPEADNFFFFVHPDQDYGYLIGMSAGVHKQYIVDTLGAVTVKNVELPDYGKHCFMERTIAFDEDGNIWIRNKKYNKMLELLYEHPCDVKVNYTHFVAYDGEKYEVYDIDGNKIDHLLDNSYAMHLWNIYRGDWDIYVFTMYPQSVVIPLNREDLKWLNRNGSLNPDEMYWLGWDETNQEWVEYDGTNARTVEEVVEIQDGVELHFDDENGALEYAAGDYFYFVVGYGIIKDMYSTAEFKLEFDLRDREEHTIDIYVNSTSYQVPEASDELFWGISDLIIEATWDHSDPVTLVKGDTTPEQDKVGYDPETGTFYFNEADFGRTFQCRYIVYKEPAV